MKILYSAFACDPYSGSEGQCGWSCAEAMSKHHDVHVLTRGDKKNSIDSYIKQKGVKIHVHYCDAYHYLKFFKNSGSWYFLYYIVWQRVAYKVAKELHREYNFDVVHHITLGDLRVIGSLWRLDTKFVFGPCGGANDSSCVSPIYSESQKRRKETRIYKCCFSS